MRKPRCRCKSGPAAACDYMRRRSEVECRCECHKQGRLALSSSSSPSAPQQATIPTAALTFERQTQLEREIYCIRLREIAISAKCDKRKYSGLIFERYALAIRALQHARSVRALELTGAPFPANLKPAPWKPLK